MEFITRPGYTINRDGESIIADDSGLIITDNQEAIEVLKVLFPKQTTVQEFIEDKKTEIKPNLKKKGK